MDSISIRYGEDVTLPLNTGDVNSVSATIFIGKPGELYTLTDTISLTDGEGVFEFSGVQTQIPLGTYYYQVNVTDVNGKVDKYPAPEAGCNSCESNFPEFVVAEALDATEVS